MKQAKKIIVLDGYTANPGDLSWQALEACGPCTIHDYTRPEEIVSRAQGADILITNKAILDSRIINALPELRYIGVTATGYNVVDIAAAKARNIIVTNVPSYGKTAVAQGVFALLLELTNHAGHHSRTVSDGRWSKSRDFCYWDYPLVELDGLTLGIIGFGSTGQAVAQRARAFGMKVIAATRTPRQAEGIEFCSMDDVFARSDILSLHCSLTDETRGLVNANSLARMKPSALLINTARGLLVDEKALADALNAGRIAGAGLDVLAVEPPAADNPLFKAKNCLITPHNSWATSAARKRLLDTTVSNVQAFLEGRMVNVVST
jgi:glycerate dehydrogenase